MVSFVKCPFPILFLVFLVAFVHPQDDESTRCKKFTWDPCDCLANGCLFDSSSDMCITEDPVFEKKLTCRRPRSHYVYSSKLRCNYQNNNEAAKASCSKGTSVWGVNVNGKDYVDADGLQYKEDIPTLRYDRADTRREVDMKGKLNILGVSKADAVNLYGTYVYGHASKQKSGGTLVYPVPIKQIGEYELIIKMIDPDYKEAKKRIFDIRINNINTIAAEVDVAEIGGGGGLHAVDISILFLVFNSVTSMQIKGSPTAIPIFNGFQLQFAYGDSSVDAVEWGYIFSAINLIRYGDDTIMDNGDSGSKAGGKGKSGSGDACESYGDNANECKSAGCEFSLVTKKCAYQSTDCQDTMYKDFSKCQRNGAVYGNAGVLCRSKMQGGVCTGQTLLALNLNAQQDYYWADRQIPFAAEKPTDSQDPDGLRKGNSISKFCPNEKSDEFMKEVLMPAVFSVPQPGKEACLTYNVPLQGQGEYELSIWVFSGKHKAPNLRCFDVKFNSVPVLYSIDPYRIGGKVCAKNELVILFKVAVSGGARLTPIGFTDAIQLKGNKVDLGFCLGKCAAADNSFQVSAFSVLKFGAATIQTGNCKIYASNANACKSAGCEYDLANLKCTNQLEDCKDDLLSDFPNCRRSEAYYSQGGVLCRSKMLEENTNCNQEVVTAININGKDYNYKERDIQFKAETENDYRDPDNIRVASSNAFSCKNDNDELFKQLLSPAVSGELGFEGCLTFPLKVSDDGNYELSIFSVDNQQTFNSKCWDVKLNSDTVLYGIDPARLNGGKECRRNELIILFKVQSSSTMIMLQGFSQPIPVQGGMVNLNICTGSCSYAQDKSFQISAISLTRISHGKPLPPNPCNVHGKDKAACRLAGCEFDLNRNFCVRQQTACTIDDFKGTTQCGIERHDRFLPAGVTCYYLGDTVPCNRQKLLLALNLGGGDDSYTRENTPIQYRGEKHSDYRDPDGIRTTNTPTLPPCKNKSHDLFKTYVMSKPGATGCITYPLPIEGDADYRLSLIVDDDFAVVHERFFDIRLNDFMVTYGLDIKLLAPAPHQNLMGTCIYFQVTILFKIFGGGTKLLPNGFTKPTTLTSSKNTVDLSFCTSSVGRQYKGVLVNSLHLHKIQADPCEIHGRDVRACKRNLCDFDLVQNRCFTNHCTELHYYGLPKCRINTANYLRAGVICYFGAPNVKCEEKTIIALNLNGKEFLWAIGGKDIQLRGETISDFKDPLNIRKTGVGFPVCAGQEASLSTSVVLYSHVYAEGGCLTYPLPLEGDGFYNLHVYAKEGYFRGPVVERCVDVKINNLTIYVVPARLHDPIQCNQFYPYNFPFKVDGGSKQLYPHGFTNPSKLSSGTVDFEICYGHCSKNQDFAIFAIILSKVLS